MPPIGRGFPSPPSLFKKRRAALCRHAPCDGRGTGVSRRKGIEATKVEDHHEIARVPIEQLFEADFADIFEVRGQNRPRRGTMLAPLVTDGSVVIGYRGLDSFVCRSRLRWFPVPSRLHVDGARYELEIDRWTELEWRSSIARETSPSL